MELNPAFSLWEEHCFWLDILKDHARFVLERLSVDETETAAEAARFAAGFESLRIRLEAFSQVVGAASAEWVSFAKEAHAWAAGYYKVEGRLQAQLLRRQLQLNLPPSFLNSTLNENQEYLRRLGYYVQGADAPELPLWELMDLWLDDQLGHARLLLELSESPCPTFLQEAEAAAGQFGQCLIRNKRIHGFLRFTAPGFPEQLEAAAEAKERVFRFREAIRQEASNEPQGRSPFLTRFLNHQVAEAGYFLRKLSAWV